MIRCRSALGWTTLAISLLFAQGAAAAGRKDALAEKALHQALDEDYLQTRFAEAEQRLRTALTMCGRDGCSPPVLAKLHAALGSVLAGGRKELDDARDEFIEALTLDPKVVPNPDISSATVTFVYEQAQKKLKLAPAGKPPESNAGKKPPAGAGGAGAGGAGGAGASPGGGAGGASAAETPPDFPTDKPPPPPDKPARRNWITLSFSPDFSVVSGQDVCTKKVRESEHFVCLRPNSTTRYVGTPTVGNADNVNTGFGLSTLRLMLGYDRLLGDNFTLGARFGFAFNGGTGDKVSFLPVHVEGRFAFWPRSQGFAAAGVRPFLVVSGGLAQVDTKVGVQVLEDGANCGAAEPNNTQSKCTKTSPDGKLEPRQQTLTVYKQAGTGFASFGAGLQFAPVPNFGVNVAVRGAVTLPVVTAVFSPELGLSLGF